MIRSSRKSMSGPLRLQRGVTLIEVLITLLVLAIGLLGLAALQGFSLQASSVSYYRTQATNVVYEVADFARANRSTITEGQLTTVGNGLAGQYLPSGTADVTPPQDHAFMYGRSLADPDGHVWEPFWMDPAAVPPDAPDGAAAP